jgi:hypothetical protein
MYHETPPQKKAITQEDEKTGYDGILFKKQEYIHFLNC